MLQHWPISKKIKQKRQNYASCANVKRCLWNNYALLKRGCHLQLKMSTVRNQSSPRRGLHKRNLNRTQTFGRANIIFNWQNICNDSILRSFFKVRNIFYLIFLYGFVGDVKKLVHFFIKLSWNNCINVLWRSELLIQNCKI